DRHRIQSTADVAVWTDVGELLRNGGRRTATKAGGRVCADRRAVQRHGMLAAKEAVETLLDLEIDSRDVADALVSSVVPLEPERGWAAAVVSTRAGSIAKEVQIGEHPGAYRVGLLATPAALAVAVGTRRAGAGRRVARAAGPAERSHADHRVRSHTLSPLTGIGLGAGVRVVARPAIGSGWMRARSAAVALVYRADIAVVRARGSARP